jgi:C-terminal processing protease CtpA/Prc
MSSLQEKFIALVKKHGIPIYLKTWKLPKNSDLVELNKSLKTYHPHSWMYETSVNTSFVNNTASNKMPEVKFTKDQIGIITFYEFSMNYGETKRDLLKTIQIVETFLDEYMNEMLGLIVDLRKHSGGWYGPVPLSLKRFLNNSSLIYFGKSKGNKKKTNGWVNLVNGKLQYDKPYLKPGKSLFPIAVLINGSTTSSGEIAAAIFSGRSNCKSFGTATKGYLSSNEVYSIDSKHVVVLTTELLTTIDNKFSEVMYPDVCTSKPVQEAKMYILSKYTN